MQHNETQPTCQQIPITSNHQQTQTHNQSNSTIPSIISTTKIPTTMTSVPMTRMQRGNQDDDKSYGELVSLLCQKEEAPEPIKTRVSFEVESVDSGGSSAHPSTEHGVGSIANIGQYFRGTAESEDAEQEDDGEEAPLLLIPQGDEFRPSVMSTRSALELPSPDNVASVMSWTSIQGFDKTQTKLEQQIQDLEQRQQDEAPQDCCPGASSPWMARKFSLVSVVVLVSIAFICAAGLGATAISYYQSNTVAAVTDDDAHSSIVLTVAEPSDKPHSSTKIRHDDANAAVPAGSDLPPVKPQHSKGDAMTPIAHEDANHFRVPSVLRPQATAKVP